MQSLLLLLAAGNAMTNGTTGPQMNSMGAAGPPSAGGGYRRKGFYKK